jgi:carboxyl-terminal processing protease
MMPHRVPTLGTRHANGEDMAMGGRVEAAIRPLRRSPWSWAGTVGLAFLMTACTAQETRGPVEYDLTEATRLFSVGYQDISDIYIDEVSISQLALAGLGNLSQIDSEISTVSAGGYLSLSMSGHPIGTFKVPDRDDADGWGRLTATLLKLGRSRSDKLQADGSEKLYEAIFDGMVTELDGFSRYAGRDEARENRASRDGFGGIGVRIRLIETGVRILSVMEDTPAERAGLKDNDIITDIDFVPTTGLNQREVVRRLRGPLRSKVELTVRREGKEKPVFIVVIRAHIVPQTVKYSRLGDIAYIRISGFNQSTSRTLRDKIQLAKGEIGSKLDGFIIDLRGNPGGLLDQAVAVSDLLVAHGRIVSTHGRHADSHQYFDAEPDDLAKSRRVILLINGNSASASEIVGASLQDVGRAVLVGSNSFGKGTVQTVLRLPNEGELTLTWARFHAPSGYALHGRGVLPDICTSGGVQTADDVLKRLRNGVLPIDEATRQTDVDPRDDELIESLRAICPANQTNLELDLEVAKRLLGDPALFARAQGTRPPATARLGSAQATAAHDH